MKYKVGLPIFTEVEIGSYCNRICKWCPNGWNERGRKREYIREEIWEMILNELNNVNYQGWFAFHNYNEPLADDSIFSKISQAREVLNQAKLTLFTNGDYLNKAVLHKLIDLGVNQIRINLYPDDDTLSSGNPEQRIFSFFNKLGLEKTNKAIFKGVHLQAFHHVKSTQLHFIVPNVALYHYRGGAVPLKELALRKPRSLPCFLPFRSAAIDYHGNLKLCCEIYDASLPKNRDYIIGNVIEQGFLNLWFSDKMNSFRKRVEVANFDGLDACTFCKYVLSEDQLNELDQGKSHKTANTHPG